KNYYSGNQAIVHFKGQSPPGKKPRRKDFYDAMKIFVSKHYHEPAAFLLRTAVSAAGLISSVKGNFSKENTQRLNTNTILIGDDADVRSAEKILSRLNFSFSKTTSL